MMLRSYPSNVTCDSLPVKKKGEQNRIPHPAMCINFPKPLIGGDCGVSFILLSSLVLRKYSHSYRYMSHVALSSEPSPHSYEVSYIIGLRCHTSYV